MVATQKAALLLLAALLTAAPCSTAPALSEPDYDGGSGEAPDQSPHDHSSHSSHHNHMAMEDDSEPHDHMAMLVGVEPHDHMAMENDAGHHDHMAMEDDAVHAHHEHHDAIDSEDITVEDPAMADIGVLLVHSRLNRTLDAPMTEQPAPAADEGTVVEEQAPGPLTLQLRDTDAADYALTFAEEAYMGVDLTGFAICHDYTVTLQFRTDQPHGLLAFLSKAPGTPHGRCHLYVYLRKGRLVVRTICGSNRKTYTAEKGGLQDGQWHAVAVALGRSSGAVSITLDGQEQHFEDSSLKSCSMRVAARLWVGGMPASPPNTALPLAPIRQFRGCLKGVQVLQSATVGHKDEEEEEDDEEGAAGGRTPLPLSVTEAKGVTSHLMCRDTCLESNPCPTGVRCTNHFSHASCDCSRLATAGLLCDKQENTILTLLGDGYLQYRLYRWRDRVYQDALSVHFQFKTNTSDSLLFDARSTHPAQQQLSVALDTTGRLRVTGALTGAHLRVELDGEVLHVTDGLLSQSPDALADGQWHDVALTCGSRAGSVVHLEPELYFGSTPQGASGSTPLPLVGCLRGVYVNGRSVLAALSAGGAAVYTGTRQEEEQATCSEVSSPSLSMTTTRSSILLPPTTGGDLMLELQFSLKHHEDEGDHHQEGEHEGHHHQEGEHEDDMTQNEAMKGVLAKGEVEMLGTIDEWMVYSDGNRVYFRLQNDLLDLRSAGELQHHGWNKLTVQAAGSTVTLTLNGVVATATSDVPFAFVSPVMLGSDVAALQCCIKELRVGGEKQDLRLFLDSAKGVVFDQCQVRGPCFLLGACQHGGRCSLSPTASVSCDCSGTGYTGNRCQFARYPTSCQGYRRHGFNTTGYFKVDLDGHGPMPAVLVQCRFGPDGTETLVHHNVPERYVVRRQGLSDNKVLVDYHGLTIDQLTSIVTSATSCQQSMTFNCTRAPLRLSSETWFASPSMQLNDNFGTPRPGLCPCKVEGDCDRDDVPCNCDINDGLTRSDSAVLRDSSQLPVTALFFIQDKATMHKRTKGELTLGPLTCFERAPTEDAVSLLDSGSFLQLPPRDQPRTSIGFGFRTSATQATLLHAPSEHPYTADYRVLLLSANRLEFQYRHHEQSRAVIFDTPYLLNAAAWQYLWIDFSPHEIRILLNGLAKYISVDSNERSLEGDVYLGGSPSDIEESRYPTPSTPGLIGCLRDLTVDTEATSVQELVRHAPTQHYNLGCALSCDPNPCRNGALCVELRRGQHECRCGNPYAEWGLGCQNSLNYNSITLLNPDTEMRITNTSYVTAGAANPLKHDVTFAFRTREIQALLLFAHDHVQNLIQVHLASSNKVMMMWNIGDTLRELTIDTGSQVLNQGQLVQVHIGRSRSGTTLDVLTRGQTYHASADSAVSLLTEAQYQQYPFGSEVPHPDLTLYRHPRDVAEPELKVYLGGAFSEGVRSKLPGFVGCLSGFKIGNTQFKLEDRRIWTWNQLTYETGCYSACAAEDVCHHGGTCMDVFQRGGDRRGDCDCEGTSYGGARCDDEIAYNFSGDDVISFHSQYGILDQPFSAALAFSSSGDTDGIQTFFVVQEPSGSQGSTTLAVGLERGTLLKVLVAGTSLAVTRTADLTSVNVTDGFRHQLSVAINATDMTVKLNGISLQLTTVQVPALDSNQPLVAPLVVGGAGAGMDGWTNFKGCISNLQFRTMDKKVFLPLRDYDRGGDDTVTYRRVGLPTRTVCSRFQPKDSKVVAHDYAAYQAPAPFMLGASSEPVRQPFQPLVRDEPELWDSSTVDTVGTVGGIVMVVVLLGVFIYVCKISNDHPHDESTTHAGGNYERVQAADESHEEKKDSPGGPSAQPLGGYPVPFGGEKPSMKTSIAMTELMIAPSDVSKDSSMEQVQSVSNTQDNLQKTSDSSEDSSLEHVQSVTNTQDNLQKASNSSEDSSLEHVQTVTNTPEQDCQELCGEEGNDLQEATQETSIEHIAAPQVDNDKENDIGITIPDIIVTVDTSLETEDVADSKTEPGTVSEEPHAKLDEDNESMTMLSKTELEESFTKLSESFEEISKVIHSSTSSSSTSSTSSSSSEGKKKMKKKRSKKTKQSGSYNLCDSDSEATKSPESTAGKDSGLEQEGTSTDPTVVSAAQLEKLKQDQTDVEAVEVQKFYLSRKTSSSPQLPPKKSGN